MRSKARSYKASCIYAVGGENNNGIKLASVERYDSETNSWTQVQFQILYILVTTREIRGTYTPSLPLGFASPTVPSPPVCSAPWTQAR